MPITRERSISTGYQYGDIAAALQQLVMAGYIGDRPDRCAPRPIFLPFSADIELLRGPNPRHKIQEPRTEKARR